MAVKGKRVVVPGLLIACSLAFAASVQAGVVYTEDFSTNGSGAESDLLVGCSAPPSLKLSPANGSYVHVGRMPNVAVTGTTRVSFNFRASNVNGDTDTGLSVGLTNGDHLVYSPTESWNPNNRVTFSSAGYGQHISFGQWPLANTCYQGVIVIDTVSCEAWAELRDSLGLLLATSNHLGITCSAASIAEIEIYGVSWASFTTTFWYDDVKVTTTP